MKCRATSSKAESPAGLTAGSGRPLLDRLFAPIDIASLVFFRIAFGAIMPWEVVRYFDHGRIRRYWIEPAYHFKYFSFEWVDPWPGN